MGKKGGDRRRKRFNTPKYIHINKKEAKFFFKVRPGPHDKDSLPLAHIIRDILKLADNASEARKIIKMGKILVDGVIRKDPRFPVGLMDVIEIPEVNKVYRILPKWRYGLYPLEISEKEKGFKLCRIENKTTVKGGHIQLNLHDGRNILIRVKDPKKPVEDKYKTNDVIKIKIPNQEIEDYFPLKENSPILVANGKNLGMSGIVTEIEKRFGPNASIIKIKTNDEIHETAYKYAMVIGKTKSVIALHEYQKEAPLEEE
ncbi:MAG: 30S ribosomal protein S4e [Promethearchaeota archaeon]